MSMLVYHSPFTQLTVTCYDRKVADFITKHYHLCPDDEPKPFTTIYHFSPPRIMLKNQDFMNYLKEQQLKETIDLFINGRKIEQ